MIYMYYLNMFFICSVLGYIIETSLKLLFFKSMNNGILFGPWVPIYGFGAVIIVLITDLFFKKRKVKRTIKIFFTVVTSVVILTFMEWISGNLIEMLFGKVFWDYSQLKFNVGHYIALEISLVWMIFILIFMYILRPLIDKFIKKIPNWLSILVLILFLIDCIVTCFLI